MRRHFKMAASQVMALPNAAGGLAAHAVTSLVNGLGYPMEYDSRTIREELIVSHKHQFVMIHIPRSAGTSMLNALSPLAGGWTYPRPDPRCLAWGTEYPHYTVREIREYLGHRRFLRYFKFAFVRHPWERLVSRYHNLRSKLSNNPAARINERGYYPPGTLSFVDWLLGAGPKRNCIHPLDMRQQLDFLTDVDGTLMVDFVGRFECLSTDFDEVCHQIGIDVKLPHLNAQSPPGTDYRREYTPEAIAFVADRFEEDIRRWNYKF